MTPLVRRFEETGNLCDHPLSGEPQLSEIHTSDVASQMSSPREQSTSVVSTAREQARKNGIPMTSVFYILQCFEVLPLQVGINVQH